MLSVPCQPHSLTEHLHWLEETGKNVGGSILSFLRNHVQVHKGYTQVGTERKKKEEEEVGAKHCGAAGSLSPAPTPLEQMWQERDSGLETPLRAEQVGQETSLVMQSLMEYYRASLGLSPGPDDSVGAVGRTTTWACWTEL